MMAWTPATPMRSGQSVYARVRRFAYDLEAYYEYPPITAALCDVCAADAPMFFWHARPLALGAITGKPFGFGGNFQSCNACDTLIRRKDWKMLDKRIAQESMRRGKSATDAGIDGFMQTKVVRDSITVDTSQPYDVRSIEYRFDSIVPLEPGTLPVPPAHDAHTWLKNQTVVATALKSHQEAYTTKFGFCIPTLDLIREIASFSQSSVVDFGAGNGYLSYLLRRCNVSVVAYDATPVSTGRNPDWPNIKATWTKVDAGSFGALGAHSNRTLILCWPPPGTMALDALNVHGGNKLVYIGETAGATADEIFEDVLKQAWVQENEIHIPMRFGFRDTARFYSRRQ